METSFLTAGKIYIFSLASFTTVNRILRRMYVKRDTELFKSLNCPSYLGPAKLGVVFYDVIILQLAVIDGRLSITVCLVKHSRNLIEII